MFDRASTSHPSGPGLVHALEAALLFGAVSGLVDAGSLISEQRSLLSAGILPGLRLMNSAGILTALAIVPFALLAMLVVRFVASARKWALPLSLLVLYFLSGIPAAALLTVAVIYGRDASDSDARLDSILAVLKYAWVALPVTWGFCWWLAGSRTALESARVYGRCTAFIICFAGYILLVPWLQHRSMAGEGFSGEASGTESLVITVGALVVALAALPIASWIATLLARPARGWLLGILWVLGLAAPFVPNLVFGPPTVGTAPSDAPLSGRQANVILVSVDTLRWDDLGVYGSEIVSTPNIDRMARSAWFFNSAVTPIPVTGPAHMSMLTGLQPEEGSGHGVDSNGIPLPQGIPTLATILDSAGYRTAAVIGGSPLSRQASGLQRGFNYYNDVFHDTPGTRMISRYAHSLTVVRIWRKLMSGGGIGIEWLKKPAGQVTDEALGWLRGNQDRPFFMFLHYYDPHAPLEPPPPFNEMYSKEPETPVSRFRDEHPVGTGFNAEEPRYADDALANRRALYRSEVSYVDRELGRLIDWGNDNGLWSNTLLIITADHGEGFDPHYIGHINRLYEPIAKVPLIVRDPSAIVDGDGGGRIGTLVNISDIYFTVLDFLEVPAPEEVVGMSDLVPGAVHGWDHSLLGLIRTAPGIEGRDETEARAVDESEAPTVGWLFVPMFTHGEPTATETGVGRIYGFRFAESKLLYAPQAGRYLPLYQYFDLAGDPGETVDSYGTIGGASKRSLEVWQELIAAWSAVLRSHEAAGIDPMVRAQLRALGYVN